MKYGKWVILLRALLGGSGISRGSSPWQVCQKFSDSLPESMLEEYSRRPQMGIYRKAHRLYFEDLFFFKEASCITQVQRDEPGNLQLTGRGVLIGIVVPGWITGILHFLQQMESPGFCVCGIRAFLVIRLRAMQQELNIPMRKLMRRCPSLCRRGGALFRLKM